MHEYLVLLGLLIFGHVLADYPLQGEFLAKAKNRKTPLYGTPWYQALGAHSAIHAGFVGIITGSLLLAVFEFIAHCIIDDLKCFNHLSFNQDQILHIACKIFWLYLLITGVLW